MNIWDIVILLLIAVSVRTAVVYIRNRRKNGGCGCSGCSGCNGNCSGCSIRQKNDLQVR